MPIKVNLPDGRVLNFPDGMSESQIATEVAKLAPAAQTAAPPASTPPARASMMDTLAAMSEPALLHDLDRGQAEAATGVAIGAGKGVGQTAVNAGKLVTAVPGVK